MTLIPEPMTTYSGEPVCPRKRGESRFPARHADELGLFGDDLTFAERAWVRPVEQADLADDSFACEWPGDHCGKDCGCWIITDARDPRRAERIWWIP